MWIGWVSYRFLKHVCFPADRNLMFLHGFQQGRLHLGRRTIDFVGENYVGEQRTFFGAELACLLIENHRADDVGGEQVRCKLNTLEGRADRLGKRTHRKRLGEPRHTL